MVMFWNWKRQSLKILRKFSLLFLSRRRIYQYACQTPQKPCLESLSCSTGRMRGNLHATTRWSSLWNSKEKACPCNYIDDLYDGKTFTFIYRKIFGNDGMINRMQMHETILPITISWAGKACELSWNSVNFLRYVAKPEGVTDDDRNRHTSYHSTESSHPCRTSDPNPDIVMKTFQEFGYSAVD